VDAPVLPLGEGRPVPGVGELFVRRSGDLAGAVPILLLHGWQATSDINFYPVFGPLGESHAIIAPDLRGHGRSLYPEEAFSIDDAADDCAALLVDLGVSRVIVVGYSLGTMVAQTLVERHPELVAGLVLMAGELAPCLRSHEKVLVRIGGWLGTIQRQSNGRRSAHFIVDKAVRETAETEQYRNWLVREMERGHSASMRAAARSIGRFNGKPIAAAHPDVPVAVVITTRDRLIRPSRQRDLATTWRARVTTLDADHDAPIAQPFAFAAAAVEAVTWMVSTIHVAATSRQPTSNTALEAVSVSPSA